MRIICAWCGKSMGQKEPLDDDSVTHGICDQCRERLEREIDEMGAS